MLVYFHTSVVLHVLKCYTSTFDTWVFFEKRVCFYRTDLWMPNLALHLAVCFRVPVFYILTKAFMRPKWEQPVLDSLKPLSLAKLLIIFPNETVEIKYSSRKHYWLKQTYLSIKYRPHSSTKSNFCLKKYRNVSKMLQVPEVLDSETDDFVIPGIMRSPPHIRNLSPSVFLFGSFQFFGSAQYLRIWLCKYPEGASQ